MTALAAYLYANGRALIAGTLQAASTSAIMSDRSSWLRLPPLMPLAAASMPDLVSSAPTIEHGGLQVLLPPSTQRARDSWQALGVGEQVYAGFDARDSPGTVGRAG